MSDLPTQPSTPEAADAALPPPPAHGRRTIAIIFVAVAAVLALGGGAFALLALRGGPEEVLDKIPATADVVVVAHLDPSASQKVQLFRMASTFPALGSREELTHTFDVVLDRALADTGLTHDDLSWVGGEAGGYVDIEGGAPSFALLIDSADDAAAAKTLEALRASSGTTYTTTQIDGVDVAVAADGNEPATAIVEGVVVIASDADAMGAVIATVHGAASVETDPTFQGVADELPADNLGFAYANVERFTDLLSSLPGAAGLSANVDQLASARGAGFSVSATSDGLAFDAVTTTDPASLTREQRDALAASDGANPLLSMVPADAYATVAANGFTTGFERSIEQMSQLNPATARAIERLHLLGPDGLLANLSGNVAVQVSRGTGVIPVGATALIGVDDAAAVEGWLDRQLPDLLESTPFGDELVWRTEDYQGTTIHALSPLVAPAPIAWAVVGDAVVIGFTEDSVKQAVDLAGGAANITSNPAYQAAIAQLPGTESVVYVDVQAIVATASTLLPVVAEAAPGALENLRPITIVAAGSESDEHGSHSRLVIEIP